MKRILILTAALSALATSALRGSDVPPTVHEVRMVQQGDSYRFQPAALTIRAGDRVRFVNVSGGPHNVSFDPARVPAAAKRALSAGMPSQMQELWGPLLTEANAAYVVSFTGVPAGRYDFFCMPHMAMGMNGSITVQ